MHHPVMLEEAIGELNLKKGDVVVDATVGGASHARAILARIAPGGKLIGIDTDPAALEMAAVVLKDFQGSFSLNCSNFRNIDDVLFKEGVKSIDAAFFDVGISSHQIDDGRRGFSIRQNGRLDMRMNPQSNISAYELVNRLSRQELEGIIRDFGEEHRYRKIAGYIVEARSRHPIENTFELAAVVRRAYGAARDRRRRDPATKTFQAFRIAVNDELGALEEGLRKTIGYLRSGSRMAAISFHSLEDRIMKNIFKEYAASGMLRLVTKKPIRPGRSEIILNPRSRSAKMRVAEKV